MRDLTGADHMYIYIYMERGARRMKPDLSARWGSDEFVSGQWRTRDLSPFYLGSPWPATNKQTFSQASQ
jgi:hypothetical protein